MRTDRLTPAPSARAPLAVLIAAVAALATAPAKAQDARPTAFTNARILTMSGAPIERGTLVVKNGKITAVGADVAIPAGAQLVDCQGGTLMPGLVSAFSRAGSARDARPQTDPSGGRRGGRRRGGMPEPSAPTRGAANQAATKVVEALDPKQEVFAQLLQAGVTTLALTPTGNGFPGLGAVLRPDGRTLETLTQRDAAFVFVGMARDAAVKKLLKEQFEQAKKLVEARKKPKDEPKPAEPKPDEKKPEGEAKPGDQPAGKPADKPGDKPEPKPDEKKPNEPKPGEPKPGEPKPGEPKPDDKKPAEPKPADAKPGESKPAEPKPEEKKNPNLEVLADLLEGKQRAVLEIGSAADLLHWFHACGEELAFPRVVAAPRLDQQAGTLDLALDQLKKLKAPVLLPPELSVVQRTRNLTNPAKVLHDAGVEVGFVLGDNQAALRAVWFRLMEIVRAGLPADVALRGVTVVPSKALGVDAEVGTLEVGKHANLLLFSGDPLDPTSELRTVWLGGKKVEARTP